MNISVTYPHNRNFTEARHGGYAVSTAACEVNRTNKEVSVEFVFPDCNVQLTGHFAISHEFARWLAGALLAAADKHAPKFPIGVCIENDLPVRE